MHVFLMNVVIVLVKITQLSNLLSNLHKITQLSQSQQKNLTLFMFI